MNYGYLAPKIGNLMARVMEKERSNSINFIGHNHYNKASYSGENYKSYEPKTDCLIKQYSDYSVWLCNFEIFIDTFGTKKICSSAGGTSYNRRKHVRRYCYRSSLQRVSRQLHQRAYHDTSRLGKFERRSAVFRLVCVGKITP